MKQDEINRKLLDAVLDDKHKKNINISLKNLGTVNKNLVTINVDGVDNIYLYFSYETIVGIEYAGETFCIKNYWGPTTGKLLNNIESDKKKRLTQAEFSDKLNWVMSKI